MAYVDLGRAHTLMTRIVQTRACALIWLLSFPILCTDISSRVRIRIIRDLSWKIRPVRTSPRDVTAKQLVIVYRRYKYSNGAAQRGQTVIANVAKI